MVCTIMRCYHLPGSSVEKPHPCHHKQSYKEARLSQPTHTIGKGKSILYPDQTSDSVYFVHQATITRQVKHVQRRAARFGYYRDTYPRIVIRLLHQLELDSLQHRRTIHVLVLCYKIRNQLVDINSENYFAPGDKRTRRSHRLGQQRASKKVYINSFFPRSARDWNRLAEQVTEAHTIEKFRTRLSSVLWSQLQPWQTTNSEIVLTEV